MMTRMIAAAAVALFATPALLGATPAAAQDGTWAAWHGCWRVQGEVSGPMVCLLPAEQPTSVRIATVEEGRITSETMVHADGVQRPVEEGGCTGTERAWFSRDGRRVFTRAELDCSGMRRVSTGVMGMVSEIAWVDARSMKVGAEHAGRSVQYRAVAVRNVPEAIAALLPQGQEMAQEAARLNAATPLEVEAVIEMAQAIDAAAAEALLAARGHGFGLNGSKLIRLADAGVPKSTIDMMVALSNPTKFAVATPDDEEAVVADRRVVRAEIDQSCDWTGYYRYPLGHPCDLRYSRYGRYGYYGYGSYFSPWGYDPYYWRYNQPVIVIVRPDEGEERTSGAIVKGRGYTRTAGPGRGTATPRSPSPEPTSSTTSSSSPSTSSTSSSQPSSSSQPTRTAKPRGGHDQ